jgi:hypothetical protein
MESPQGNLYVPHVFFCLSRKGRMDRSKDVRIYRHKLVVKDVNDLCFTVP